MDRRKKLRRQPKRQEVGSNNGGMNVFLPVKRKRQHKRQALRGERAPANGSSLVGTWRSSGWWLSSHLWIISLPAVFFSLSLCVFCCFFFLTNSLLSSLHPFSLLHPPHPTPPSRIYYILYSSILCVYYIAGIVEKDGGSVSLSL